MIIESLIALASNIFSVLISGLNFFSIPSDLVDVLATVCVYGNWIIGSDVLLLFSGCVASWFLINFGAGVLLFIYRLIPFNG